MVYVNRVVKRDERPKQPKQEPKAAPKKRATKK